MTNNETDQILKRALAPEIPDEMMNKDLKRRMEEKEMKRMRTVHFNAKKAAILAAACCLLFGTAAVASSGKITSLVSGFYHKEFKSMEQLPEAERCAGFSIKAVESFQNGYAFSDMCVHDTKGVDEEGNTLETYREISINYEKAGEDDLTVYAVEAEHFHSNGRTPDKTVSIMGTEVKYYVDTYKYVPVDYELTAADEENLKRSDYFISEGTDQAEAEEVKHTFLNWTQGNVAYCIMDIYGVTPPEVMFGMAEELITK